MQKLWETRQQVQACTPRQRARGHKTRGRRLRRGGGAAATERRGGEELLEVWGHRHRHPNVDSVYVCMCICVKPIWPELLLMAARGSSTVSAVQVSLEIRAEWRDLCAWSLVCGVLPAGWITTSSGCSGSTPRSALYHHYVCATRKSAVVPQ